jgi:hypothetical protein
MAGQELPVRERLLSAGPYPVCFIDDTLAGDY